MAGPDELVVRHLGLVDYVPVWHAMQQFTDNRDSDTTDEIWLLQHPPVFTQGQAGKPEHLLNPGDIPVIQVDRGGQVTYHGPGQLVAYLLIDLKRHQLGVRDLVTAIEHAIVNVLASYGIRASPRADAPGVYINEAVAQDQQQTSPLGRAQRGTATGAKIAQLGLRVRQGCSFHGLSLNVDMDMQPFLRINPCGHVGMAVTSMSLQLDTIPNIEAISSRLLDQLAKDLRYTVRQELRDGLLPTI